jgi:hypothetical protein
VNFVLFLLFGRLTRGIYFHYLYSIKSILE